VLGGLLCLLNHCGVIAGIVDPPPGYQPLYYLGNQDVPQYLTWIELARTHWLLPDNHAPWRTEPALFQPMFDLLGRSGLPARVSYYSLEFAMYVLAAYALILAAETFLKTRRAIAYGALAVISALPLMLLAWGFAKALGLAAKLQPLLAYGLVQYGYDTADGLARGGLSNSFTLTFGTAMTLFAFTNLAKYVAGRQRRHYVWLAVCVFLDAFFHPFEIFVITVAAVGPLWAIARRRESLVLFSVAGVGMLPYLIQVARSSWVRDVSQSADWRMGSPAWVLLVYGLPAILICWLMLIRFRVERPEDGVLQSWFLTASLLPMIPLMPAGLHTFDGFAYCAGFLLVRKAQSDPLISRLFRERRKTMRVAALAWGLASSLALVEFYAQVWKDGRSAQPDLLLSSVAPQEQFAMLAWMKTNLPHEGLVLAPERIAPWVAAIPMPSFASHDLFSITYQAQRRLADRFYQGEPVWRDLIDAFGVHYIIAPVSAPIAFEQARLLHQESSLRLYEIPGERMKPYPGAEHIAGAVRKNSLGWIFHIFAALGRSAG
jgi:hypothetical protein